MKLMDESYRSLKDLSKALGSSFANTTYPLPDDLLEVIHAYLEKHAVHDTSDSQRLQEELLLIFHSHVQANSSRLAPFLAAVRILHPLLRGSGRLLQWWDKLSPLVLKKLGEEKGVAQEAKNTILDTLVYDEDDEEGKEDAEKTSEKLADNLLSVWLKNNTSANLEFNEEAKFIENQLQLILLAFGRRRPKVCYIL